MGESVIYIPFWLFTCLGATEIGLSNDEEKSRILSKNVILNSLVIALKFGIISL